MPKKDRPKDRPAKAAETLARIEPTRLERLSAPVADAVAALAAASASLGRALHPRTAANLGELASERKAVGPAGAALLTEVLHRGEIERGEAGRVTGLPERSARRILNSAVEAGLLGSETPRGPVSLRFPSASLEVVFPRLYL